VIYIYIFISRSMWIQSIGMKVGAFFVVSKQFFRKIYSALTYTYVYVDIFFVHLSKKPKKLAQK